MKLNLELIKYAVFICQDSLLRSNSVVFSMFVFVKSGAHVNVD